MTTIQWVGFFLICTSSLWAFFRESKTDGQWGFAVAILTIGTLMIVPW